MRFETLSMLEYADTFVDVANVPQEINYRGIKTFHTILKNDKLTKDFADFKFFLSSDRRFRWMQNYNDDAACMPFGPYTSHTFSPNEVSDILEAGGDCVPKCYDSLATDTFEAHFEEKQKPYFCWLNSPVCRTKPTVEELLRSLKNKRRDRLSNTLTKTEFLLESYSVELPSPAMINCVIDWLRAKWGDEDADHALVQFYWALADDTAFFLVKRDNNIIKSVAWFVSRSATNVVFQGIAADKEQRDYGATSLVAASVLLNKRGVQVLDTTCRTMFEEHSSDTYKRSIVNEDNTRPTIYIDNSTDDIEGIYPPYFHKGAWHPSEVLLFSPV